MLVRLSLMNKKTTAFLFLLASFISLFLYACSPQTAAVLPTDTAEATVVDSPATETPFIPTPSPVSTEAVNLSAVSLPEGIQLEFWHPWSGELANLMAELVEQFNQENQWGITVTVQVHADELVLLQDMDQAAANAEYPDVVAAPSAYLKTWYRQGWPLLDLTAFTDSPEYGLDADQLAAFLPVFWKNDLIDEVRLGLPAFRDGHFLFYNQSWAQQMGFDAYPQTSLDFQAQACAAAAANLADAQLENNGTGGWLYDTRALTLLSWLRAFNGDDLIRSDGEISFAEEGSQVALEYLFDMYYQNCAWTGKQSEPFQYFADRYALFYSGDSQDIFTQEIVNQNVKSGDDWMLIPYPSDDSRPVVYVDGDSYAVFQKDIDKELAAWLFLRYLNSTENQIKVIQATGSLPFSTITIGQMSDFRKEHPVWDQALQYLALAQPIPDTPGWMDAEAVLSDMAWQLKYTAAKENLPAILNEAERIIQGN
ncbi:ABC-type glycerol-3-phosphate transport system substrate-binding protein [Pelolinea submarina]|uniref:ABC-type glycerol-3-phosphate transport system substrate-binding protein n=2 Tax=Pelolinea submarina TaxID=913107 RepID=A0A3E0A7R2_9CHLR|nr:ABC-type glycerol-3-phosphate transport system substrate-binding protein [Pelolinea submarina]